MATQISVIICTHNPREDYLRRVLEALDRQTLGKDQWELLLIDNASGEPLSGKYDLTWHPSARHVREEELGLTPARLRGIREAVGEILVFVDDDNVLDGKYLATCMTISSEFKQLGCFGAGCIVPEFEIEPPPDLIPFLGFLALREIPKDFWCNQPECGLGPWGAGLVVRREVAIKYTEENNSSPLRRNMDRKGSSLVSGGDDLFSFTAFNLGYGVGVFNSLKVLHLIPRKRLNKDYFLKIAEAISFSVKVLQHLYPPKAKVYGTPSILNAIKSLFLFKRADFLFNIKGVIHRKKPSPFSLQVLRAENRGRQEALKFLQKNIG